MFANSNPSFKCISIKIAINEIIRTVIANKVVANISFASLSCVSMERLSFSSWGCSIFGNMIPP